MSLKRTGSGNLPLVVAGSALVLALIAMLVVLSERRPAGPGGWLTGSPTAKLDTLAYHQRGFGRAMWEVGYRYRELAWAGGQKDWGYALYQLDEIELTLEQAIQRRPVRAENTRLFITEGMVPLRGVLKQNPQDNFPARLELLKAACVNCHAREEAPIQDLNQWVLAN